MHFVHFTADGKALHVVSESTNWTYASEDCRKYKSIAAMTEQVFNSVEFIVLDALAMHEQLIDFSVFPNLKYFVFDIEEIITYQLKAGKYSASWFLQTMLPHLASTARNNVYFRFVCLPKQEHACTGENTDVFEAHEELMQLFQRLGVM